MTKHVLRLSLGPYRLRTSIEAMESLADSQLSQETSSDWQAGRVLHFLYLRLC